MREKVFLTAEWSNLIIANYEIDESALEKYIPAGTEPDYWQGKTYISLVGFLFRQVRVLGIKIPFHTSFPEVNLRFYVRYKDVQEWKRGVVFVREIVPKPAISFFANALFHENYITLPMRHFSEVYENGLHAEYAWRYKKCWYNLKVMAKKEKEPLVKGSKEEFITEHFWGYSAISKNQSAEYHVEHPRWDIYPVMEYEINCDFGDVYGEDFKIIQGKKPASVFLAEGSPVKVFRKRRIL